MRCTFNTPSGPTTVDPDGTSSGSSTSAPASTGGDAPMPELVPSPVVDELAPRRQRRHDAKRRQAMHELILAIALIAIFIWGIE